MVWHKTSGECKANFLSFCFDNSKKLRFWWICWSWKCQKIVFGHLMNQKWIQILSAQASLWALEQWNNCSILFTSFSGLKDTIFSVTLVDQHTKYDDGDVIRWNQVLHDPGKNYYPDTGAYSAPANGYYLFTLTGRTDTTGHPIHVKLRIGVKRFFVGPTLKAFLPNIVAPGLCCWKRDKVSRWKFILKLKP